MRVILEVKGDLDLPMNSVMKERKITGKQVSRFHNYLYMLQNACKKLNIMDVNVLQGRSFSSTLNLKNRDVDTPHIDILTEIIFVVLYMFVIVMVIQSYTMKQKNQIIYY